VRCAPILVLVIVACSSGVRDSGVSSSAGASGPDAILVRLPLDGGTARAYRWGSDSSLWTSAERVPRLARVLAFDDDQGSLAYVDARGMPGRLDLRVGSAQPATAAALTSLASADGWAIYGITSRHEVSRLTPSGEWTFKPEREPRVLLPVADGSLVLMSEAGRRMLLHRIHPPEPRVTDTASVPAGELQVLTALGDRIYFLGDSGLAGVRVRDLARTRTVRLPSGAADAVATPSGDRIFVALRGRKSIAVIDRYAEAIERTIDLPVEPTALRMDPDGRYVLVRAADGDSVRIVAVGTSRLIGSVRSAWRADLPLVGPDGAVALAEDKDVVLVDADTRHVRARFAGGSADVWALVRWNGFRPRAAGLDEPVRFASDSDSTATPAVIDSALAARVAPAPGAPAPDVRAPASASGAVAAPAEPPRGTGAPKRTFTLSFAAMLSEDRANTLATTIRVDGHQARVVPSTRDGTPIFRVVYGPFNSHDDADRAGRRSGLPYWVYEGAP
jgi:cell division septation protein DedD